MMRACELVSASSTLVDSCRNEEVRSKLKFTPRRTELSRRPPWAALHHTTLATMRVDDAAFEAADS